MSHFVNAKMIVICIVYLTLLYTTMGVFVAGETGDYSDIEENGLVQAHYAKPTIVNVNGSVIGDKVTTDEELQTGAIVGGVGGLILAGILILASIPSGGLTLVPAVGILTAGGTIGAIGGATVVGIADQTGGDAPIVKLAQAMQTIRQFIGAFIGMWIFLLTFLALDFEYFTGILPEYLYWLVYIMIVPIWFYFAVALSELAYRAVSAIRG